MTVEEALEQMYNKNSEYSQIIDKLIAPHFHYKNDLLGEIAISYLTNKEKVQKAIDNNYFKYYFIMTVKNQVHSSTSLFHKNIRLSDKIQAEEDIQLEDVIDQHSLEYKIEMDDRYNITQQLKNNTKMTYFESEMMRLYFDEEKTYRAIAEEYGINHTLIFKTIQNVVYRLKKQIDQ